MRNERFEVAVTFDERRGYVAAHPKKSPALSGAELRDVEQPMRVPLDEQQTSSAVALAM
jgi:hypothetical protein